MVVKSELNKIYHELKTHDQAQYFLCDSDVTVRVFDNASKIGFLSPIYFGGNYIPKSVREGIKKSPPFEKLQAIKTYLTVDETNCRVFLHYIGTMEALNQNKLHGLIEEFEFLSAEWRIYLDEHDKNDLVYVRQPK